MDSTVKRETAYIATAEMIMSAVMQAVFIIIGMWDYTVLLGNLLGALIAVSNFLLMGLGVQSAVIMEEKEARTRIKMSYILRMLFVVVLACVGVFVPIFNTWSTLIPLLFPRIAVACRPLFNKTMGTDNDNTTTVNINTSDIDGSDK